MPDPMPKELHNYYGYKSNQFSYEGSPDEEAPIPFTYSGTPRTRAWVIARHYASITGEDGVATIERLPSNKPLKFRVFHPYLAAAFPGCKVGDQVIDENNCVTLTLQSGVNDLGEIDISNGVRDYSNSLDDEMASKKLTIEQIREKVQGITQ